jgi:hypothetical protein
MGIIDDLYRGGQPAGSGRQIDTPYYGSFQHIQDMNNGLTPPPADQGGPTVWETYQNEGLVDEQGFLLSNPNVHSITAALYGGGPQKITKGQSLAPNWEEGRNTNTVGGIGNTDGWGGDIVWDTPISGMADEGQVFRTGAGDYLVKKNSWGQFVLEPMEGAIKGTAPYVTNFSSGEHHLGVNPETGEVWYQKSTGVTTPYSSPPGSQATGQQRSVENAPVATQAPVNQAPVQQPAAIQPPAVVQQPAVVQPPPQTRPAQKPSQPQAGAAKQKDTTAQLDAVRRALDQRARQEGMLSGDNPDWTDLTNLSAQMSGGMGPFMLGQLARRR